MLDIPILFCQPHRPSIVCLCGSTRFGREFFRESWKLALRGIIVLSIDFVDPSECAEGGGHAAEMLGQDVADRLDDLHKRKIDLADTILVLNVGGYIGNSTRSEIAYAQAHGKHIDWLELENIPAPYCQTQEDAK